MPTRECLDALVTTVLQRMAGSDCDYVGPYDAYINALGIAPSMCIEAALDHFWLSAAIGGKIQDLVLSSQYWRIADQKIQCYALGMEQGKGYTWLRGRARSVLDRISRAPDEIRACDSARSLIQQVGFAENGGEILVVTNLPELGIMEPVVYSTMSRRAGGSESSLVESVLCSATSVPQP